MFCISAPQPTPRPQVAGSYRDNTDPCLLDRTADVLLQQGYQHQAERLSHLAAQLREAVPMNPTDHAVSVAGFDYSKIAPEVADEARAAAARIQSRIRASISDTGHDLIAIKDRLPHGAFGDWIVAEFGMSERTAQNYMHAARFLIGKSATVAVLPPAAIYALSAPSAPSDAVKDVLKALEAGAKIPTEEIRNRLSKAADAQRKVEAAKTAEQIKKEREAEKRRREIRVARDQRIKQDIEQDNARRSERAREVAKFLVAKLGSERVVELLKLLNGTDWSCVERYFKPLNAGRYQELTVAEIDAEFNQ